MRRSSGFTRGRTGQSCAGATACSSTGREVLAGEADFYESRREPVVVGKNYIACQHCGPEFRGRILEVFYNRSDDQ